MVEMMQYIDDKTFAQSELVQAYYHEMAYGHIPMHTHNFHELNIIISGNGKHHLNGATTRITVGDLFIMPPGVPHGYDFASENFSIFHLLFHKNFLKNMKVACTVCLDTISYSRLTHRFRDKTGLSIIFSI